MDKPHRQYELTVTFSADSLKHLTQALRQTAFDIERGNIADGTHTGLSAGYNWSSDYRMEVDADMTHDRWEQELNDYLNRMDAKS